MNEFGVRVADVDFALRPIWRLERLRRASEFLAVLVDAASPVGLVANVGLALDVKLFLQAAPAFEQPLAARARDRLRLLGALLFETLCGGAQPPAPAFSAVEDLGQLVAASVAICSSTTACAIASKSIVRSRLALAATLVPSIG